VKAAVLCDCFSFLALWACVLDAEPKASSESRLMRPDTEGHRSEARCVLPSPSLRK
jgi:hypothetical protein